MHARLATWMLALGAVLTGFAGKDTDAETVVLDSRWLSEADTDTNAEVSGVLFRTLRLQLYEAEKDDVREYVSWDEMYDQ